MSSFAESGALDSSYVFNFHESDLHFAFGVEGYLDKKTKDDTRFIKWLARLVWKRNGVEGETIIPYHRCTREDFSKFAPPADDSVGLFELYKKSETRHLFCLDLN